MSSAIHEMSNRIASECSRSLNCSRKQRAARNASRSVNIRSAIAPDCPISRRRGQRRSAVTAPRTSPRRRRPKMAITSNPTKPSTATVFPPERAHGSTARPTPISARKLSRTTNTQRARAGSGQAIRDDDCHADDENTRSDVHGPRSRHADQPPDVAELHRAMRGLSATTTGSRRRTDCPFRDAYASPGRCSNTDMWPLATAGVPCC